MVRHKRRCSVIYGAEHNNKDIFDFFCSFAVFTPTRKKRLPVVIHLMLFGQIIYLFGPSSITLFKKYYNSKHQKH